MENSRFINRHGSCPRYALFFARCARSKTQEKLSPIVDPTSKNLRPWVTPALKDGCEIRMSNFYDHTAREERKDLQG